MKRWIKYGLIGIIIGAVLYLILNYAYTFIPEQSEGGFGPAPLFVASIILTLPAVFSMGNAFLSIILLLIYYFLIGAIIGLIVDKVKSKRK